ncbi:MAG TPA: NnrS family protein [Steroidobacteraceae bacterium]|nr:NnrS family protein [Steroidobacteraceae bacterium]
MRRFALFDYGFRPFFLLAGLYAAAIVPAWLYLFAHRSVPFGALPAMYWHSHELVYGFVAAAIAGFLLTAVPSWTGARGFAGWPLITLVALWIAGRLAMATLGHVPFVVSAVAELALLPALIVLLAPPLLRSQNRNTPLLAVVAVLWLTDAAFLLALRSGDIALADGAIRFAINLALILITVVGGRIVPSFTANALRRRGDEVELVSRTWLETLVIASMIAIALLDLFRPNSRLSGALAALAAIAQAARLSGWRSFRTRGESILWVLHVAYAWLPLGLALKACWLLFDAGWAIKWLHAFTVGLIATMILAVMTRASLGHTGRPLAVSPAITIAYVLLTLAALLRVFGGAVAPGAYLPAVTLAGLAWTMAFLIYLIVYAPILIGPRVDGKPG